MTDDQRPRCYFCLSYDVAFKVIDQLGFEHWVCAEDDEANQRLRDWLYNIVPGPAAAS